MVLLSWIGAEQLSEKGGENILGYLEVLPKVHEKRYGTINKCRWLNSKTCEDLSTTRDSLEYKYVQRLLPLNWCGWGKAVCKNCIVRKETKMTWGEGENKKLIPLLDFKIKLLKDVRGNSSLYNCKQASLDCTCSKNITCTGSEEYCAKMSCDHSSLCKCTVEKAIKEVTTENEGRLTIAPHIYSYFISAHSLIQLKAQQQLSSLSVS